MPLRLHIEDPELLRRAIEFTARETGFSPRLIEKDYFCSVALEYVAGSDPRLVFKGGTCLSKIHSGFYRLSEDLDFTISMPASATRSKRSRSIAPLRAALRRLEDDLPSFRSLESLRGANNSTQYVAATGYTSLLDGHIEPVSIEVGLREPLLLDPVQSAARTILLDPITGGAMLDPCSVASLSYVEAMAEKVRAALCRREAAIRDYFDIDHAFQAGLFDPLDTGVLELIRRKIGVPGTNPIDVTPGRLSQLRQQLATRLRPVLRELEFVRFDIERVADVLRRVASELERQ